MQAKLEDMCTAQEDTVQGERSLQEEMQEVERGGRGVGEHCRSSGGRRRGSGEECRSGKEGGRLCGAGGGGGVSGEDETRGGELC